MKITLFIFFIFLNSVVAIGQVKEVYANDDLEIITKAEFDKVTKGPRILNMTFDLDTLKIHVKVETIKKGKLAKSKFDTIRKELSTLSNSSIPTENIIIIDYYQAFDTCWETANRSFVRSRYKNYVKRIKKDKDVSQFFMYKTADELAFFGKDLQWIEDKYGTIEKTFFPIQYPCSGYVLINKEGNFYVQKGEGVRGAIDVLDDKNAFSGFVDTE